MQKPITVAKREFSEAIVGVVNSADLPFFVVRQVLEELLSAVRQGEEDQERKDRAAYEEYLREAAEKEAADHAEPEVGKEGATHGSGDDSDIQGQEGGV